MYRDDLRFDFSVLLFSVLLLELKKIKFIKQIFQIVNMDLSFIMQSQSRKKIADCLVPTV